jgi:NAD(P)-dependent dehydrogenase (short-subunit alcohol dehydrogenase family)
VPQNGRIEGLTAALAQELPSGMASIALNPGIIHTDMLDICFGEEASYYTPIDKWVEVAAPFILNFSVQDNGVPKTVPI